MVPSSSNRIESGLKVQLMKVLLCEVVLKPPLSLTSISQTSPSIALFQNGQIVHFIERHHIEGRSAQMIADNLKDAFTQVC